MSPSVNAWYPLGAAACCTPALLLASGDAWELERCGCAESTDVNCGGTASSRLLSGYQRWRCARERPLRAPVLLECSSSTLPHTLAHGRAAPYVCYVVPFLFIFPHVGFLEPSHSRAPHHVVLSTA